MANCRRLCEEQSVLAPASTRSTFSRLEGSIALMQGRSIPGIVFKRCRPMAKIAPEFPALTTPSTSPFLCKSKQMCSDESFLLRRAVTIGSSISTTCEACAISTLEASKRCLDSSFFRTDLSPTRITLILFSFTA